jgi:hypothetical protein
MTDKDLYNLLKPVAVFGPIALDADNTPVAIDLVKYASALLLLHIGIGGITFDATNKVEFKLTHSDDDSTYTAVTVDDVVGLASVGTGGIVKSLVAAHAAASLTAVGYKGGKRYLKLLADFAGTHGAATPMSAVIVKGGAMTLPAA